MTRFAMLSGLILVLSVPALADEKKEVPKELIPFQGKWKILEASQGGMAAPKEELENLSFTFDGEKLAVTEKGREENGSFSVDSKKDPATIDLVSPKGDKILGIYKFDKDGKLTLCFIKGKDKERPKNFEEKEAAVIVMEKVKK